MQSQDHKKLFQTIQRMQAILLLGSFLSLSMLLFVPTCQAIPLHHTICPALREASLFQVDALHQVGQIWHLPLHCHTASIKMPSLEKLLLNGVVIVRNFMKKTCLIYKKQLNHTMLRLFTVNILQYIWVFYIIDKI